MKSHVITRPPLRKRHDGLQLEKRSRYAVVKRPDLEARVVTS